MHYQITPIAVDGFAVATGLFINSFGAWLGQYADGETQPYINAKGHYVAAPFNWVALVRYERI